MITLDMATTLTAFGAFVGVVGISIAIWLQMIARRRTPASAVGAFFLFGSFMLLLNSGAFGVGANVEVALTVAGLSAALVVELAAGVWVYLKHSEPRPSTGLDEWFDERFDLF